MIFYSDKLVKIISFKLLNWLKLYMVTGNFKNEISTYIKFVVKKSRVIFKSFSGMKVYPIWTKLFKGNERENMRSRSVKVLVTQSCPTLCNPMDCSPPGSSDHGIFQARILEWVAMPTSRGSCRPRDQTWVSCTAGRFFTIWATKLSNLEGNVLASPSAIHTNIHCVRKLFPLQLFKFMMKTFRCQSKNVQGNCTLSQSSFVWSQDH